MIQTDQILKERHSYVAVTNNKTETPAQNNWKLFLFSKTENFTCVLLPFISSCIWNDIHAGSHSINEEFDSVPDHTSSHHTLQYRLLTVSFDAENGTVKSLNLQLTPKNLFHFNFSWFNVYSMTVSHVCGSVCDHICSTAPEFALRNYGKITKNIRQSGYNFYWNWIS